MKKFLIIFGCAALSSLPFYAQEVKKGPKIIGSNSEEYQKLKESGQLGDLIVSGKISVNASTSNPAVNRVTPSDNNNPPAQIFSSTCYGYTPPEPTATPTLTNIDDQGVGPIALPFNFCLYGTTYTSFYLNSNGNVTFGAPYTTYTASGFPSAAIPAMLAPFWGDVDTRSGNGTCYYDIYSNAAIFHWVDVGYFSQHGDKRNTFQLIITDFTSPLLQPGNNVGFFYENMDWTTGDASGGTNGFGGTAATVGVNEGNGVDYIQMGRFDGPGQSFDGAFNLNDSVDWLDNKTFMFDVCNSGNIAPIVAGIDFCDTVRLCVGDTVPINVSFLAPESNQTIWADVDTSQASGYQIISNNSGTGSSAQINSTFIADTSNVGVNILTFTAYDNGTPPDTIQFDYIIIVDSIAVLPVITGDTVYCPGGNVILDAGVGFDSYLWSNSDTSQTTTVTQGSYTVQAFIGGCSFTTPPYVVSEHIAPTPTIIGDTLFCAGDSVLLSTASNYSNYSWSTSANDTLNSVYVTQGSYTVTVTDTNGCQGASSAFNVAISSPNNNVSGITSFCSGTNITITSDPNFASYLWSTGDTTQSVSVSNGTYTITVTDQYGCEDIDTVTLVGLPLPNASFTISPSSGGKPGETITFADASTISSGIISSWGWDFDVTNLTGAMPPFANTQGPHDVVFSEQGTYSISLNVIADNGCEGSVIIDYIIVDDIIVPNVITPNGDIFNDYLVFKNLEYHTGNHLVVLNRWGKKIYEKDNYENNWYAKDYAEGTYFFILTVDDLEKPIKGTFTLLK